ncbi:13390_t:CDS:2, partial [Funneliformis geosporum]
MGRQQHFLTPYVIVLHAAKKANKSNKYAAKDGAKLKSSKKRCHTKSSSSDESSVDDNNSMLEQNKNNNLEETLS